MKKRLSPRGKKCIALVLTALVGAGMAYLGVPPGSALPPSLTDR